MKKINYLLLMVLLSIPFTRARAIQYQFSSDNLSLTIKFGLNQDGSAATEWSHGSGFNWWYNWGGVAQTTINNISTIYIYCENGSYLSDQDIYRLRDLINNHSLRNLNLYNAQFIVTPPLGDYKTEELRISADEAGSISPMIENGSTTDYTQAIRDQRTYLLNVNEFGEPHYGHSETGGIGTYAFCGCTNLQSVTLPQNLSFVSAGCFDKCTNLTSITIPATVTKIDWQAFEDCSKLAMVNLPSSNNLTTVNSQAFQNCTAIKYVDPFSNMTNVTTIGYRAFKNVTALTQSDFAQLMTTFKHGNVSSSDGDYYAIPYECFYGCTGLTNLDLSGVYVYQSDDYTKHAIKIRENAFSGCTNVATVTLPTNLNEIQAHAFAGCPITSLTVTNAAAPETVAEGVNDPFSGVTNTNTCTVHFPEDNDINTNEYGFDGTDVCQSTITTGYKTYYSKPAFKRLLTKALNENNTYDAAPQMHAIVNFTRSFKTGWNTLVLPFGSPAYVGNGITTSASATALYKTALHKGSNSDFMIAGYRGLKNGSVFTFLKMEDNYELDEFEPLVVYMGANDITSASGTADGTKAGTYTFTDVNLNYDRGTNNSYSASTVAVKADWKGYNSTDATKSWFSGNTYTEFNFTGTFNPFTLVPLISNNDYFIKDGFFYKVTDNTKVHSNAFRGWFHYLSGGAAKASFGIDVSDEDGNTVTGIMNINAQGEISQLENIYNLNGQIVRANATSTDGLSKGLYIVNGKKVIIK